MACFHQVVDGQVGLVYFVAPVTQDVDQGITGYARKYGSFQRCGVDFAGDLEHDVHGSNFLYIFTMYAVQPQNLGASHLLCFYLACDGTCIVTAAFCKSCATFDCTNIFILNQDLNRVDALCIVCSNRSGDDNEFVGFCHMYAKACLSSEHERTDVKRCTWLRRYPVFLCFNQCFDSFYKHLLRYTRHAESFVGFDHTACVHFRTEQLDFSFCCSVCFHTLESFLCIVKYHGCRIHRDSAVRYDCCVMPSLLFIPVHDKHIVCKVFSESKVFLIRFFL